MALLFIPLFVAVMSVHLKYSRKYVSIMRARLSDMNAMISESIAERSAPSTLNTRANTALISRNRTSPPAMPAMMYGRRTTKS